MQESNRLYGLDTLRAMAIILVYLHHYELFILNMRVLDIGWVGVDLFFVLSGYLIGNQIFSSIANKKNFLIRTFIMRRLMRTLPNYFVILALYFTIPEFREQPNLPSLWRFLTFTVNFGLSPDAAFSHAWSLCIEEQFYLTLPLITVFIYYRKSINTAWSLIIMAFIGGIFLRSYMWLAHTNGLPFINPNSHTFDIDSYCKYIYFFTLCRLDDIIFVEYCYNSAHMT